MKILYGERMTRYDLLKAVCHSASCITKWTRQNDVEVYRLICYIQTTIEHCQHSFCGNSAHELQLAVYADADWEGDTRTHKSTSGCALALLASHTKCMLSASSRRQTCTSHSTPEAEIVAADAALRTEALPAIPLWEHLLKRRVVAAFKEDNEAVIKMLNEIESIENIKKFIDKAKDKNDSFRLMGFGHRVYKNYDPRAKVLQKIAEKVLKEKHLLDSKLFDLAKELEYLALNYL